MEIYFLKKVCSLQWAVGSRKSAVGSRQSAVGSRQSVTATITSQNDQLFIDFLQTDPGFHTFRAR